MKQLFSGKLSNGSAIEVVEAESFSGKIEFAVKVNGEVVSISTVHVLRGESGTVVKTQSKNVKVTSQPSINVLPMPKQGPTLDDIRA